MGFGGNGAPACPPAHRPRQLQSVSLSPLIKYRATNYFPLMFLLNMGGHNYCSFSLSILAPSRQRDTRILYTHRTKIHTCDRIIRFIRHTRIRRGRRHQRRGGWERCGENDKETLFRRLLHVDRHVTSGTEGDCISCLTTSGENPFILWR